MPLPIRSIRLEKRTSKSLDTLSGESGEIFFDAGQNTLRIYTANQSNAIIMADREWVADNTFSSDYNDLTNKPTVPTDVNQLSDATNLLFSGDYNDLTNAPDIDGLSTSTINNIGDVDTVTNPLAPGQLLEWNGSNWINTPVVGLSDTNTTYSVSADGIAGGASINLTDSDEGITNVSLISGTGITVTLTDANTITLSNTATYELNDLTNVSVSPPTLNQVIGWNGSIWSNIDVQVPDGLELTDFSAASDTASGNGALSYNNNTGVFTYTPPDLSGYASLDAFSVTTSAANSGGSLTYSNGTFTFRPAAITGLISLTDLTVVANAASGDGALSYDNTTGQFTYTPPNLSFTNVVDDLTPQLGGNLDLNSSDIVGTGNIDITGTADFTGTVTANDFAVSAVGAPAITSASTITLDAPDGTIVQNGPFRLPSLTTIEKNALTAVNGDMVYDSTLNKAQVRENGAWVNLV